MPSDDLLLNVRQIGSYAGVETANPTDVLLLQRGGLGGAYATINPVALVSTALTQGGNMVVAGAIGAQRFTGGAATFTNAAAGLLSAQKATFADFESSWGTINGVPIATQTDIAALASATVSTVNGRRGDVVLTLFDVPGAAPIYSPRFFGDPRAPTPDPCSHSSRIATTSFVWRCVVETQQNMLNDHPFVFSFNGRTGDVTLQPSDVQGAEAALLNSPPLTGTPTAPTAPPLTSTTQLATTEFVTDAVATASTSGSSALTAAIDGLATVYAPINSPIFTGFPSAPTAPVGTASGQIATTAFVMDAVAASVSGVATFNTRSGNVTLNATDIIDAGGAPIASPNLTGVPTAPTAAIGTATGQLATTAFVMTELGSASVGVMSFNGRGGAVTLTTSDITAAGGAPSSSPVFTGNPTAPTQASGTNNTAIATTAFVVSAIASLATGVSSFNGRSGAITLNSSDVSAAGGLANPSVGLTGVPTAPTAAVGVSTTQLATTAFVMNALATVTGIVVGTSPPASPNSGQGWWNTPEAQLYIWTGQQWVIAVNPPLPLTLPQGVTDGSNAQPGQVGEVISALTTTGVAMATNTNVTIATITLTPGDWDVSGEVYILGTGITGSVINAYVSPTAAPSNAPILNGSRFGFTGPIGGSWVFSLRTCRVNVTVATTYYLIGFLTYSVGTGVAGTGVIWARRAR